MQENTSSASESLKAGNRVVAGGIVAIVLILLGAAVFLFLNLPDAPAVMQSEELLVVETMRAAEFAVGDALYGVPRHICPTVALHSFVTTVDGAGHAGRRWLVTARERQLTV